MMRAILANSAIAAVSFGAVSAAGLLQDAWHLQPCTMCIIQRYAFLALGIFAMTQLSLHGSSAARRARSSLGILTALAAGLGLLASLKVQWAISVPSVTCGRDRVAAFLNGLPWVDFWPSMFEATGVCGDEVPPVLGIPFHGWSGILFLVVLLLAWHQARGNLVRTAT